MSASQTSKSSWAAKSLRSGFGTQPVSTKASSPAAGFGSSNRDAYAKQYASADADKAKVRGSGGDCTIGAAYNVPSTIEKQVLSTVASPPKVSFGTSKREGMASKSAAPGPGAYKIRTAIGDTVDSTHASAPRTKFPTGSRDVAANKIYISADHEKCQVGQDSPGPGSYLVPAALGRQQLSTHNSAGTFKMPRGQRFVDGDAREAAQKPAPGAYNIPSSIGGPADGSGAASTKSKSPTTKFSKSTRDQEARVYISHEHEKGAGGSSSPGPITASPTSGMGRQAVSTKHSAPSVGFGSGKRLAEYGSDVPGPGAYYA